MKITKLVKDNIQYYDDIMDYWMEIHWWCFRIDILCGLSLIEITSFDISTDSDLVIFENCYVWKKQINENSKIK